MGEDYCPNCHNRLDAVTGPCKPNPNDKTVCIYCGAYLWFADDMHLKLLTDAEFKDLQPQLKRQLMVIRLAIIEGKKGGVK